MSSVFDQAEEVIEEGEDAIEEIFRPRPGGLIDRHRQREAAARAREESARNSSEPIEQHSFRAVKVAQQSPEGMSSASYLILPGQWTPVLAMSPYRFRASLTVSGVTSIPLTPGVPAGGGAVQNPYPFAVVASIQANGATGISVTVNGVNPGQGAPISITIPPYQIISLGNYATATPTWTWAPAPNSSVSASAILAKDSGAALGQVGYTLPSGVSLALNTRAQVIAYNPGTVYAINVSVISELYAPEK